MPARCRFLGESDAAGASECESRVATEQLLQHLCQLLHDLLLLCGRKALNAFFVDG